MRLFSFMRKPSRNVRAAAVACAVVVGLILVAAVVRFGLGPSAKSAPLMPSPTTITAGRNSDYDYGDRSGLALSQYPTTRPADEIRASAMQWPQSPQEQTLAMTDRLDRVVVAVNRAASSDYVVRLGQTGRAAMANDDGTITVDANMLWRLSEDALAALIAHETAHETLGHAAQFKRLETQQGQPGYAQQVRALELAADEMAGRLLARTPYGLSGVRELLRQTGSTAWEPTPVRQYYPPTRRWAAYEQAFNVEHRHLMDAGATSRPAGVAGAS